MAQQFKYEATNYQLMRALTDLATANKEKHPNNYQKSYNVKYPRFEIQNRPGYIFEKSGKKQENVKIISN